MSFKKWSKKLIGFIFLTFMSTVLFNFIVDPYAMFNTFKIDGFNSVKNRSIDDAMGKFYHAKNQNPTVLFIGSSRTEHINPKYLTKYLDGEIYNLSMKGSGLDKHQRNIEYFIKNKQIKTIIYGIDFFSFSPVYNLEKTNKTAGRYDDIYYDDYLNSLLGFKTFRRSISTVTDNVRNKKSFLNYQNGWSTYIKDYNAIDIYGDKYLRQKVDRTLKKLAYSRLSFNFSDFKKTDSINKNLNSLSQIISICKQNNVKLYIFIPPIFSEFTDLIYTKGYDDTYKYWKKTLAQYESVYDFSGYNSITKDIHYFIDGSHHTKEVGKLILARMFNDKSIEVPNDFGKILTKNNVDDILIKQEKEVSILNKYISN